MSVNSDIQRLSLAVDEATQRLKLVGEPPYRAT